VRRFVFNADDFGWTRGHNAAVARAHHEGVLDRASLMANGDAFTDAVAVARGAPALGIGVHLQLHEGRPVLHPSAVRPLVDGAGRFAAGLLPVIAVGQWRPGTIALIREEWRAQIARVVDAGITPTHLDSHKHVHLLPRLLEVAIALAREFAVPWVRLPRPSLSWRVLRNRGAAAGTLWALSLWAERRLRAAGLQFADHFVGFDCSGRMDAHALVAALASVPPGVTEVMVHPAARSDDLAALQRRYAWARAYRFSEELEALCDAGVRELARGAASA
jgi:hopanoid biosynthesis associated protein HpnK